ncbi:SDR family NAD(P)-dependent oxidoreductase [bacterium]
MSEFKPKIVLITGCSSGFGMLTAVKLSNNREYHVFATMRNLDKKEDLVTRVQEQGGHVDILELDVTKKNTIENAVNYIKDKHGYIDVLVNNAGFGIGGCFEDLSEQEIRNQFEVNFFGVQQVTRMCLRLMHGNGNSKIINISSIAGLIGYPGLGAYNSSKWALEGFSESLRHELLQFGIQVLLVEPGSFQTKIFEDNARFAGNMYNKESKYYDYSQRLIEKRQKSLKKIRGKPEHVADLIIKLIKKKKPAFRTVIGKDAKLQLFAKKILPYKILEYIMKRIMFRK